jgi:hypothetical protein
VNSYIWLINLLLACAVVSTGTSDIGVATMGNKKALFATLWIVSLNLKHTEASFSPISIDSLCLWVAQVPRSQNMAIFVQTDRQISRLLYPLLHMRARGVISITVSVLIRCSTFTLYPAKWYQLGWQAEWIQCPSLGKQSEQHRHGLPVSLL